jgi:hypothetical protein
VVSAVVQCTKCGGEIDARRIEASRKVKAKLYPGVEPPPPKDCASCQWEAFQELIDDDGVRPRDL